MPQNFRDLKIWQEGYRLALEVYEITRSFPRDELFGLTNQIRRASVSIPSNIAEGTGRWGVKDKIQFLMIARGSLTETQSHLSIAFGLKYLTEDKYKQLDDAYEILARSLNAFIKSLKPTN